MSRKTKDVLDVIIPLVIFWVGWWFMVFKGFPLIIHDPMSLIEKLLIYIGLGMIPTVDILLDYRKRYTSKDSDNEDDDEGGKTSMKLIVIMVIAAFIMFVEDGVKKLFVNTR